MTKHSETELGLSTTDKTPKPWGWGVDFHHTEPQRRVPCILGDMLAPRSADAISPISPAAMESVQAALKLLANLIADYDHNSFLAYSARQEELVGKARDVLLVAKALTGILRVSTEVSP